MNLNTALSGKIIPAHIRETLVLVDVPQGQLVVHQDLATDALDIFNELFVSGFHIAKVVPVVVYGWDDDQSMRDNNTSAFNYRTIAGTTQLSYHAYGRAIDINPLWNPYVRGEVVAPIGAVYDPERLGTIVADGPVVAAFKKRGWTWGGDWIDRKDWQPFEKTL